ncbi:MAG: hypothetical protein WCG07_01710 [Candidatus Taylorbacteria bacterium]
MVNPFDRNFFIFFSGFALLILCSFAFIFLVQKFVPYNNDQVQASVTATTTHKGK